MAGISPARKAAFQILLAVEHGRSHSDDLLRGHAVSRLSAQDRNLTTTLVLGVLRWQVWLDEQIRALLKRPNAKLDAEILIALRMGAFQLLHLDRVPARAAIDESVELAKQAGHRFASGMVNAVLRKLSGTLFSETEKCRGDLAAAQSHPQWMVQRWAKVYGDYAAAAICKYGQTEPRQAIRILDRDVEAALAKDGVQLEPGEILSSARIVAQGDVTATAAFREGHVRVQDEGSQLVAEIACRAAQDLSHEATNIMDVCAAPGGKTLILAERFPNARIVACEASAQRLASLRERLAGYAARVECRLEDATLLAEDTNADLVLADVPCSGTGTLGRNPEIRHRITLEDLPRQAQRQRAILNAALCCVRVGGRVVYSTCSLEPEENEQVIAAALAENSSIRRVSLERCIERMSAEGVLIPAAAERLRQCLTPEGALRLLPGVFKTDGFFIALLERNSD